MIDLHCHVLAGIDDGPATIEGSVALARAAAAAGTATLVATPHVSARYRNDASTITRLVDELNTRLEGEGVALEILPGAEIAITSVIEIEPSELPRLGLGDGPWLLMEPPFTPIATGVENILASLQREGYRILLAHPERCPAFHRDPAMLESLVAGGVLDIDHRGLARRAVRRRRPPLRPRTGARWAGAQRGLRRARSSQAPARDRRPSWSVPGWRRSWIG